MSQKSKKKKSPSLFCETEVNLSFQPSGGESGHANKLVFFKWRKVTFSCLILMCVIKPKFMPPVQRSENPCTWPNYIITAPSSDTGPMWASLLIKLCFVPAGIS